MAQPKEFDLPDRVRDQLWNVGELIIFAISPDKADGLSDAEMAILKKAGPPLFSLLEGRGLPNGFSSHFSGDVIPDLERIRHDAVAREAVRDEIRRIMQDPEEMRRLYTGKGTTFSDILHTGARHVNEGMFRTPGSRSSSLMERAEKTREKFAARGGKKA